LLPGIVQCRRLPLKPFYAVRSAVRKADKNACRSDSTSTEPCNYYACFKNEFSLVLQNSYHISTCIMSVTEQVNHLNPELNPICYLLALLGAHHFLHGSRIRVKSLTFRLLMSYIYGAPILDVSRSSHNDAAQSVGLLWTSDQLVAETST